MVSTRNTKRDSLGGVVKKKTPSKEDKNKSEAADTRTKTTPRVSTRSRRKQETVVQDTKEAVVDTASEVVDSADVDTVVEPEETGKSKEENINEGKTSAKKSSTKKSSAKKGKEVESTEVGKDVAVTVEADSMNLDQPQAEEGPNSKPVQESTKTSTKSSEKKKSSKKAKGSSKTNKTIAIEEVTDTPETVGEQDADTTSVAGVGTPSAAEATKSPAKSSKKKNKKTSDKTAHTVAGSGRATGAVESETKTTTGSPSKSSKKSSKKSSVKIAPAVAEKTDQESVRDVVEESNDSSPGENDAMEGVQSIQNEGEDDEDEDVFTTADEGSDDESAAIDTNEETVQKPEPVVTKSKKITFGDDDEFNASAILPETREDDQADNAAENDSDDEAPDAVGFTTAQEIAIEAEELRLQALQDAKIKREAEEVKRKERIESQREAAVARKRKGERLSLDFLKAMNEEVAQEEQKEQETAEAAREFDEPPTKKSKKGKRTKFEYNSALGVSTIKNGVFTIAVADDKGGKKKRKGHRGGAKISDEVKDFKKRMLEERNKRFSHGKTGNVGFCGGRPAVFFGQR